MQQHPLLQTKLYMPPVRPELVSRPRLIERLNAGLDRKLTLISAPAGFGKTTLVSEWVQAMSGATPPIAVAWLSLDEGDDDPTRFLAYLVAALRTTEANIGKGVLSALQSPQPPPVEAVLISLINEIAAVHSRIILVLDDHHTIESSAVDDALAFLLERLPPRMHLVIASREDPPLPLARLRARGQLTEVRASDLRFTSSEAAEFLNQAMGLNLSAEDIAALEKRTEGWIAGLQLAALSMQGREDASRLIHSFTGSHRYVLDYLVEEVLEHQSENVQTFLLRTAILDRLTGPLCDTVRFGETEIAGRLARAATPSGDAQRAGTGETRSDRGNGQAILETLERANLFIVPLDEERRWYRYHHLFADLLRRRLCQRQPDLVPKLHHRASLWYERNRFVDDAVEHALRGLDFERAADLIEGAAEELWLRDQHGKLGRWLDRLPAEFLLVRPGLCIFHAGYLFASGEHDAAESSLQAAEQTLDTRGDSAMVCPRSEQERPIVSDGQKLLGRIAATRAFMASYRSDALGVIPHARKALAHLPEKDITWRGAAAVALGDAYIYEGRYVEAHRTYLDALEALKATGNTYLVMNASMKLALNLRSQGRLQQAIEVCQQQLKLAGEKSLLQTEMVGWLLAIWGEILAELDDLEGALKQASEGVERAEGGSDVAMLTWSYMCLTRVLFSRDDLAGAEKIVTETERIARESIVPAWVANMMAIWRARIWLAQGKLDATLEWVQKRELHPDAHLTYVGALLYIALARILVAREQYDDAIGLLERLLEPAETGGHVSRAIEILNLQAVAFHAQGDTTQAMSRLERALAIAEPGGFIRTFADEGPPMARVLYEALSREIAPDYVRRLLAAFPSAEPEKPEPTRSQVSEAEFIEPLSERELEVLELIAQGLTNREIGTRLFLSLNTVKAHTRNIYGKLGVHSRTQATARSQALGILPRQ
ncbi:MAG: tetratricopeptide repeat protein [Anaerolineales bacterium]|nr:MAG: tetratricopeptide repeat protein [Anaerolineales bacterium]